MGQMGIGQIGMGRVITLEDWALIRRLAAEGVPNTRIADRLGSLGRRWWRRWVRMRRRGMSVGRRSRRSWRSSRGCVRCWSLSRSCRRRCSRSGSAGTGRSRGSGRTSSVCVLSIGASIRRTGWSGSRRRGAVRSVVPPRKIPLEDGSRCVL